MFWSGIEVVITALTRNQVGGNVSWVRIPLTPENLKAVSFVCFEVFFSFKRYLKKNFRKKKITEKSVEKIILIVYNTIIDSFI